MRPIYYGIVAKLWNLDSYFLKTNYQESVFLLQEKRMKKKKREIREEKRSRKRKKGKKRNTGRKGKKKYIKRRTILIS